jgi:hypothetical protein
MGALKRPVATSMAVVCFLFIGPTLFSFMCGFPMDFDPIHTEKGDSVHMKYASLMRPSISEMMSKVDESKLREHVQSIQDFGPHPTGSETLDRVGEYIYAELSSMIASVNYHSWSYKRLSGKNIVATLPCKGGSDGIVIICAHYDSIEISPGADDDGSGVAAVLMIAEIMSCYSFNTTVKFILFSGEEQGLLGSHEYAREAYENRDNIIGVLALDKIGYAVSADDGKKINHHFNPESEWMADISEEIADVYFNYFDLEIIRSSQDSGSDHKSFVDYGYDGSDFVWHAINPYYHTSEDTIEHMNMSYLTKACMLSLGTFASMACLHPKLYEDDLKIIIKGSYLSDPSQLYIRIENLEYDTDTANVTISVRMNHVFRGGYVQAIKELYTIPCNWSFTKEIGEYWEFKIGGRKYSRGLFSLEVIVEGINDDIHLYEKQQTFGIILNPFKVMLLPRV